jgi:hypothetical protein
MGQEAPETTESNTAQEQTVKQIVINENGIEAVHGAGKVN